MLASVAKLIVDKGCLVFSHRHRNKIRTGKIYFCASEFKILRQAYFPLKNVSKHRLKRVLDFRRG